MKPKHKVYEISRGYKGQIVRFSVSLCSGNAMITFKTAEDGYKWKWTAKLHIMGDHEGYVDFVELEVHQLVDFALDVLLAEGDRLQHLSDNFKGNFAKE